MEDKPLTQLMSELARLLSGRSQHGNKNALEIAHRRLRSFAKVRGYDEAWCDRVLLTFLHNERGQRAA